jgi:predicted kinase
MKDKNYKPLELAIGEELSELHKANINVSEKNGFYIYNYNNAVLVPRDDKIIRMCRGLVLNEEGKFFNYPFYRFFNYHEEECDKVDMETATVLEKLDGSLISVWHTGTEWEVTTRGSFYPNENAHNFKETFLRLFDNFDKLIPTYCYMFEMISKDNRIVTKYDEEKVVLLGVRDIETLDEFGTNHIRIMADRLEVDAPKHYKASNIEECRKLFDDIKDDEEGLVVVDKNFNRFKLKQESYLKMAKIISLKNQDVLDYLLGRVELDADFTDMPELKEKTEQVSKVYEEVKNYSELIYENIKHIKGQKEFALEALKYKVSSALFSLRKGRTFDETNIRWDRLVEFHESIRAPEPRKLIILRGVPGCGKSTWIKENNLDIYTLSSDSIRLMFGAPNPYIPQTNDIDVWSVLFCALENRMRNGDFTVIDACHVTNKSIKRYKKLCEMYDYVLIEKSFEIDIDEAIERNNNREEYKKVPEDVIRNMHTRLTETFKNKGGVK